MVGKWPYDKLKAIFNKIQQPNGKKSWRDRNRMFELLFNVCQFHDSYNENLARDYTTNEYTQQKSSISLYEK